MKYIVILFFIVSPYIHTSAQRMAHTKHSMLCLGDSYTIGESVSEDDRFPNQCVKLLQQQGIYFEIPPIIAKTGWTTDELIHAIKESQVPANIDFVTLLIGVNNQYRGYDKEVYRKEFSDLLRIAVKYANGDASHVFVLSIPDWGVTPFGANDAKGRSPEQIGKEIDEYNTIAKELSLNSKVHFVDINPISKEAAKDPSLIANDNLHPSGKMYAAWADLLAKEIKKCFAR